MYISGPKPERAGSGEAESSIAAVAEGCATAHISSCGLNPTETRLQ